VHGVRRRLPAHSPYASLFLACLGGEGKQEQMGVQEASPLFFVKRGFHCIVFPSTSLLHLTGRGGEEVGRSGFSVGWRSASPRLEIRLSTALPTHRPLPAGAIRGHRGVHTVLDATICASFFLCERIFCRSGAAPKPQPSGVVPGWDWGGTAVLIARVQS
jgi:hypothetical protein